MEPTPSSSWFALQTTLQELMEREVYLMRELLSNIHQEQATIIMQDKAGLSQVLNQRSYLLDQLSSLRTNKLTTLKDLEKSSPYLSSSIEINSLVDQLCVLNEKIHKQLASNKRVSAHPDYYQHLVEAVSESQPAIKKAKVITLQIQK